MKRITSSILLSVTLMFGGCTSKAMTAPSASVMSIEVRETSIGGAGFQLNALAQISDGSSRDVTTSAQWQSSNASLAKVSSIGAVSIAGNGEVEFRATYQTVTGSLRLLVGQAPPLPTFVLSGTVREAGTEKVLPGARIAVSGGSIAGALATSDVNGRFSFSSLPTGTLAVETTRDGYLTPLNATVLISEDTNLDVWMFAIVPLDASGALATARCADGSWSWARTRVEACVNQNGIAYPVCPGPLCSTDASTAGHLKFQGR
jgi:hypothetical protein